MQTNIRKFIAGARCPSCQLIDKIVLLKYPDFEKIECVSCGYKQTQPFDSEN